MTHGGAGAIFPLLILLLVSLPTTLIWVFRGQGNARKRRVIGFSQVAICAIAIILCFSGVTYLQSIGFVGAFIVLIAMLFTPLVLKNRV
ncbi:hypothetical protein [Vibrio nigripulchritudo]|uniref:hypothetical protein n=1 Tax=Vibrio nigripulchritudo TaxID=28173 RepID=UPI00056DB846|nr:hypothetical protein [Vibrio nigripulchritudo]